jgi:hypothetical protein
MECTQQGNGKASREEKKVMLRGDDWADYNKYITLDDDRRINILRIGWQLLCATLEGIWCVCVCGTGRPIKHRCWVIYHHPCKSVEPNILYVPQSYSSGHHQQLRACVPENDYYVHTYSRWASFAKSSISFSATWWWKIPTFYGLCENIMG